MRRTTNILEVDEVKDLAKENGPTSLGSEVHDTAREANECNCTQLIPFCYILLLCQSLMHIVCMQLWYLLTLNKFMPKRILKRSGKHILSLSDWI